MVHEVREKLLVNDGDDAGLVSLARADLDSLPVKVNVSDIQVNELLPSEAEPIQRFEDAAVADAGDGQPGNSAMVCLTNGLHSFN